MLDVAARMFQVQQNPWMKAISSQVPSYGVKLNDDPGAAARSLSMTAKILKLKA
jgi:malate dehydrogenase (quinone)